MRTFVALAIAALLVLFTGCAKNLDVDDVAKKAEASGLQIPPAPTEGTYLAEAAQKVPIQNGPSKPQRKVLSQTPQERPCWAVTEGKGCPVDSPGTMAFVGMTSGEATREGAILNGYQDAIERLADHLLELSSDKSPQAREKARAWAYYAAGVHDKSYRLKKGAWTQQWQERYQDSMRIYHRAFVLLLISEKEMNKLVP